MKSLAAGEGALLAAGWCALGIWIGAILAFREVGLILLIPAAFIAWIPFVQLARNANDWLDAVRHNGRRRKQCLVLEEGDYTTRCDEDTREGGGLYGRYCAEHWEAIKEIERRSAGRPGLVVTWRHYKLLRDGSLRWGDYTLYKLIEEGREPLMA